MQHLTLTDLSNAELARLLMSALWRVMDLGGVSMRRHMRSALLEASMELEILPHPRTPLQDHHSWESVEIASARTVPPDPQLLLYSQAEDLPVSALPGELLARLLLSHLREWYTQNEDEYMGERTIATAIAHLLPIPANCPSYHWEELYWEANDRIINALQRKFTLS